MTVTVTRALAISAADRAAAAVWRACEGPKAFAWWLALGGVEHMAQFVERNPAAPAEAVYGAAVSGDHQARPWRQTPLPLRVSVEVFRATLTMMLALWREDQAVAEHAERQRQVLRPSFRAEMTFEDDD